MKSLFLICSLLFACSSVYSQPVVLDGSSSNLPEIGIVGSSAISIEKEKLIGDIVMRQIRAQANVLHDPVMNEYLQGVGNSLVLQANNAKFPFTFFWINNPTINAFATFGGHVGVHTGLLMMADTEDQLASVLAHEIAHVTQRHIARRMESAQRSTPLAIAGMVGAILAAAADPEAGMAALSATTAANTQAQINYTRMNEEEADSIGLNILSAARYDPAAASQFFEKLMVASRNQNQNLAFLRTHPLAESRVNETRAKAARFNLPLPPYDLVAQRQFQFLLAKSRAIARTLEPKAARERLNAELNALKSAGDVRFKDALLYGLALVDYEQNKYQSATQSLTRLLRQDPTNLFYLDSITDAYIAVGRAAEAIELLEPQYEQRKRNTTITLNLANALIQQQRHDRAIELLRDHLLIHGHDYLAYSLLAEAYAGIGDRCQMHQVNAERLALLGVYPRAIDELQFAYKQSRDDTLEKQRISARIEQFREQQERIKRL